MTDNAESQNAGDQFYVASMGLGRKFHLHTGLYSTKCLGNKLGDVSQEIGPIPHPGGKLTLKKAEEAIANASIMNHRLVGIDKYNLCPRCFPDVEKIR